MWVPAHPGAVGNDKVDMLAKEAVGKKVLMSILNNQKLRGKE